MIHYNTLNVKVNDVLEVKGNHNFKVKYYDNFTEKIDRQFVEGKRFKVEDAYCDRPASLICLTLKPTNGSKIFYTELDYVTFYNAFKIVCSTVQSTQAQHTIYCSKVLVSGNIDLSNNFKIKKVIFNDPATIVFWNDGTKTVVKCMHEYDEFDREKGLAMAYVKKALGNKYSYYDKFTKPIRLDDKKY